jgi:hypothetical protein
MQKNLKTIGAFTEATDFSSKALKKNSSRDTVPLNSYMGGGSLMGYRNTDKTSGT